MTVKIEEHFKLVNDIYSSFSVMCDSYSYCHILWTSFSLKDCLKFEVHYNLLPIKERNNLIMKRPFMYWSLL